MAIALIVDAKKGMSALQLSRHLKVNYRTAWYLAHRIREAMLDPDGLKLTGTVEIDETYIGGKQRGHKNKLKNKDVVLGMRQRGGPLRLVQVKDNKQGTLYEAIAQHVDPKATTAIMTDDAGAYNFRITKFHNAKHSTIRHSRGEYVRGDVHTNTVENGFSLLKRAVIGTYNFRITKFHNAKHSTIRHSRGEYVRGDVHTNTVENGFSLLKRAVIGTYHQLSIKHLQRYLNEFSYRFNRREDADMFEATVGRMAGIKPMSYAKLIEQNAFTPFVRPDVRTSEPF
jgi:hypothetical protein